MNDLSKMRFIEVPPPAKAPVQDIAETLGLCAGLKAERSRSQYRCAACDKMQPGSTWLVWVPDSVMITDPVWSVIEAGRLNARNGSHSGWCLSCALKVSGKKPQPKPALAVDIAPQMRRRTFWDRILGP